MHAQAFLEQKLRIGDVFLFPFVTPIAALLVIDPNQFILGWNEGAGAGLLFAFVFLAMEWYDARRLLKFRLIADRVMGIVASATLIVTYFVAVYALGQSVLVAQLGFKFGYVSTPQILSWTRMWDYVLYTIYTSTIVVLSFGFSKLKHFPTPMVFLSGMAFILLLDATFPYGSMQSLQALVQPILAVTVFLLRFVGVRVDLVGGESLAVWGQKGFLFIDIYWQCAGILSMSIYFMVIIILMVKLETSVARKLVYAALGAMGTYLVNIVRIFLIIYYGAFIDVNLRMFHESIGEVLFTIWIVAYLLIVTAIEARLARTLRSHVNAVPLTS